MSGRLRIVTVVGARPQFIKAAVVSQLIRNDYSAEIDEYFVHTGQHYDRNMSKVFFDEMGIPTPDRNLGVGSGSHGRMTGEMLIRIEEVLQQEKPDWLLVYGDTNSTLAGALAASKELVPVAHAEAGLRSYNRDMPEEQNRVLTDHLSELLFCPSESAVANLCREGITSGVVMTGDIMLDAMKGYLNSSQTHHLRISTVLPKEYYLLTLHRAENTDDSMRLEAILKGIAKSPEIPAVFPVHPRTNRALKKHGFTLPKSIVPIEPVGYMDMLQIEKNARFFVTDSGGVQKEAYFLRKPCITIRDETEWLETVHAGANVIVGAHTERLAAALANPPCPSHWPELYGDGKAGERMLDAIVARGC